MAAANVVIVNPDRSVLSRVPGQTGRETELERQQLLRLRTTPATHDRWPRHRAAGEHRTAGGPRAGARERCHGRGAVPQRIPVPQPRRAAGRGRAIRSLSPCGRRNEGLSGDDPDLRPAARTSTRRARRTHRASRPIPPWGFARCASRWPSPGSSLTQLRAILRASLYWRGEDPGPDALVGQPRSIRRWR